MGLPLLEISFKEKAQAAARAVRRGIVAVILLDATKSGADYTSYSITDTKELTRSDWTEKSLAYIDLIFSGNPKKVLIERVAATAESVTAALERLKKKTWNWLAIPQADDKNATVLKSAAVGTWIIEQRGTYKKTFKAVLPSACAKSDPGIVWFDTTGIKIGSQTFTTAEFCARIAGLLAGLPLTESAIYKPLKEVTGITESTSPDADINGGKFILIDDGEYIRVARGVTSYSGDNEEKKKIKIVEAMDIICEDIRNVFINDYMGSTNSYDNKMLFISAVNDYFKELAAQGVLDSDGENTADIDVEAQRAYLAEKSDVSDYTDEQIRRAKTGSNMFLTASVRFLDAAEDMHFSIIMD